MQTIRSRLSEQYRLPFNSNPSFYLFPTHCIPPRRCLDTRILAPLPYYHLFRLQLFMIKRMASKITAHIGGHHYHHQHQSKTAGYPLPSPADSTISYPESTNVTPGVPVYEHRESISTQRTSASTGDADSQPSLMKDPNAPAQARFPGRKTQRPKGTYRLSDFIIQRTLGTGSFGRVHLGTRA